MFQKKTPFIKSQQTKFFLSQLFDELKVESHNMPSILQSMIIKLQLDRSELLGIDMEYKIQQWQNALKILKVVGQKSIPTSQIYDLDLKSTQSFLEIIDSIIILKENASEEIKNNINIQTICTSVTRLCKESDYKTIFKYDCTPRNLLKILAILTQVENVPIFVIVQLLHVTEAYGMLAVILHEIGYTLPLQLEIGDNAYGKKMSLLLDEKYVQPSKECIAESTIRDSNINNFKDFVNTIFKNHKDNFWKSTKALLYSFSNTKTLKELTHSNAISLEDYEKDKYEDMITKIVALQTTFDEISQSFAQFNKIQNEFNSLSAIDKKQKFSKYLAQFSNFDQLKDDFIKLDRLILKLAPSMYHQYVPQQDFEQFNDALQQKYKQFDAIVQQGYIGHFELQQKFEQLEMIQQKFQQFDAILQQCKQRDALQQQYKQQLDKNFSLITLSRQNYIDLYLYLKTRWILYKRTQVVQKADDQTKESQESYSNIEENYRTFKKIVKHLLILEKDIMPGEQVVKCFPKGIHFETYAQIKLEKLAQYFKFCFLRAVNQSDIHECKQAIINAICNKRFKTKDELIEYFTSYSTIAPYDKEISASFREFYDLKTQCAILQLIQELI